MWYRVDFSAILGGIIGFIIMLIVIVVFWFPPAVKQFIGPFLN
jgi:hypothetical protein